jgi:hypothetical protein
VFDTQESASMRSAHREASHHLYLHRRCRPRPSSDRGRRPPNSGTIIRKPSWMRHIRGYVFPRRLRLVVIPTPLDEVAHSVDAGLRLHLLNVGDRSARTRWHSGRLRVSRDRNALTCRDQGVVRRRAQPPSGHAAGRARDQPPKPRENERLPFLSLPGPSDVRPAQAK